MKLKPSKVEGCQTMVVGALGDHHNHLFSLALFLGPPYLLGLLLGFCLVSQLFLKNEQFDRLHLAPLSKNRVDERQINVKMFDRSE